MVRPDRVYRLKDEQEFATYQHLRLLDSEQLAAVYAQLDPVIEELRSQTGPFSDRILKWRPESGWTRAMRPSALPPGWDPASGST